MKKLMALYMKDSKSIRIIILALFIVQAALIVFVLATDPEKHASIKFGGLPTRKGYLFAFQTVMWICQFFVPVLLGFMLYDERRNKTSLQVLSLPVRRSSVMLGKYLAVLSFGIVYLAGMVLFESVFNYKIGFHGTISSFAVGFVFLRFMGIVCITGGVLLAMKRHQFLAGIILFPACFAGTSKAHQFIWEKIHPHLMDVFDINTHIGFDPRNGLMMAFAVGYEIIPHLTLLCIGLILYEKFSDV